MLFDSDDLNFAAFMAMGSEDSPPSSPAKPRRPQKPPVREWKIAVSALPEQKLRFLTVRARSRDDAVRKLARRQRRGKFRILPDLPAGPPSPKVQAVLREVDRMEADGTADRILQELDGEFGGGKS